MKPFEEFNAKYRSNAGKTMLNIIGKGFKIEGDFVFKKSWNEFIPGWDYVPRTRESVNLAVYTGEGAEDWQFFRVGLKGLSTQAKLRCLQWYREHSEDKGDKDVRIDNYLGALIRGGQLNSNLEIQR